MCNHFDWGVDFFQCYITRDGPLFLYLLNPLSSLFPSNSTEPLLASESVWCFSQPHFPQFPAVCCLYFAPAAHSQCNPNLWLGRCKSLTLAWECCKSAILSGIRPAHGCVWPPHTIMGMRILYCNPKMDCTLCLLIMVQPYWPWQKVEMPMA